MMDSSQLKNLAEKNEVRIDKHREPPYFYDSLRNAYYHYFKTFITKNSSYESYIISSTTYNRKQLKALERQFLDEENTYLTIVLFQRFFELFLKDLLKKTNMKLVQSEARGGGLKQSKTTWELINKIKSGSFSPYKPDGKGVYTIPFNNTIKRFYDLIDYSKDPIKKSNSIVKKFSITIKNFTFLDNSDYKSTFEFLNWYRDRILHNGNKLPRLRFLDFIITKRVIPITVNIINSDTTITQGWLFFTKTITGIEILQEMMATDFDVRNLKNDKTIKKTIHNLLYLAHLKELGRANMNMNNFVKMNHSTYEYNYRDPIGRGKRFAEVEVKKHPHAKIIISCHCCGNESKVFYEEQIDDFFNSGKTIKIQWVKCYVCEYHLRYNVGDLSLFNDSFEPLFDRDLY